MSNAGVCGNIVRDPESGRAPASVMLKPLEIVATWLEETSRSETSPPATAPLRVSENQLPFHALEKVCSSLPLRPQPQGVLRLAVGAVSCDRKSSVRSKRATSLQPALRAESLIGLCAKR